MLGAYLGLLSAAITIYFGAGMWSGVAKDAGGSILWALVVAFVFAMGVWWTTKDRVRKNMGSPPSSASGFDDPLTARLKAYATLSGLSPCRPSESLLTVGEHQILLGIIKKVEAKNAVLAAVAAIVYASLISVAKDLVPFMHIPAFLFFWIVLFLGLFVLFEFVSGAYHISNQRAIFYSGGKLSDEDLLREMQADLGRDLVSKEASLYVAESIVQLSCILLVLASVCEGLARWSEISK